MIEQIKKIVRLKRLKPSMRQKKRYVVIGLGTKKNLSKKESHRLVDTALLEGLGMLGYAKASVKFIQFDTVKEKVIICINRKQLANVKTSIVLAGLACTGVSGTLKRARQKFLK